MSLLGKKIGQFRQWTGEKLGNTQRTETSDEFKRLEADTEIRRANLERLHGSLDAWNKTMTKLPSITATERTQRTPLQGLSHAMTTFGSSLPHDSVYGRTLLKVGQVHEEIALEELQLASEVRDGIFSNLTLTMDSVKEYQHLRKKLENRRLDFDAKLNKVQKSKKESPELEEETRVCQAKYEESLTSITEKMIDINTDTESDLQDILQLIDYELAFHQKAAQMLSELRESLADLPRQPRPTTAGVPRSRNGSSSGGAEAIERRSTIAGIALAASSSRSEHDLNTSSSSIGRASTLATRALPPTPPVAASRSLKRVKVLFDFDAEGDGELTIRTGEIINVLAEIDEGWWEGEIMDGTGRKGMFPSNYCEVIQSSPPVPGRSGRSSAAPGDQPSGGLSGSLGSLAISGSQSGFGSRMAQSHSLGSLSNANVTPAQATSAFTAAARASQSLPVSRNVTPPRSSTTVGFSGPSAGSMGAAMAAASAIASANTAPPCALCGCNEFVPHAFKQGQCNNCYHKH
ncbi:hypothetical protein HK105_209370 [Polyrhizophydium stewartii]|uniref:BAR-domain-containing protein n=1 Tax=Polyrhizophydium stewartii TaxID=2732419 RepID=A0ABR4MV61_9FUNG